MNLLADVTQFFLTQGLDRRYWLGFSGGLDSHVLLSLCYQVSLSHPLQLTVVHINHQLNPAANQWSQHCARIAALYEFPFAEHILQLQPARGESLEASARAARYAALQTYVQSQDVLLTAHHQDDQAETLLLQLCRGAGISGLAAMPCSKPFGLGCHARPLLAYRRAQLKQYALERQLQWIEDDSNRQLHFTRNFLRHAVIPTLKNRWPSVSQQLARSAQHCAEAQSLLMQYGKDMLITVVGSQQDTLSLSKLLQLDAAKQRLVLRTWIQEQGFIVPNMKKLAALQSDLLTAHPDRQPLITWDGVNIRRYRDDLYIFADLEAHARNLVLTWQVQEVLHVPAIGYLRKVIKQGGIDHRITELSVRFRQGGERLVRTRGTTSLKNCWQAWGVPTWLRDRIPLVYNENELVAVVGYYLNPAYLSAHEGYDITLSAT